MGNLRYAGWQNPTPYLLFEETITSSLQCTLDSGHHGGTIGARQHSHLRCSLEFGQKLCSLRAGQLIAGFIQASRAFFDRIVVLEDGTDRRNDGSCGRRHEQ